MTTATNRARAAAMTAHLALLNAEKAARACPEAKLLGWSPALVAWTRAAHRFFALATGEGWPGWTPTGTAALKLARMGATAEARALLTSTPATYAMSAL